MNGDNFEIAPDDFDPEEYDVEANEVITDAASRAARSESRRVEQAIRGAIHAGYDGLDVNLHDPLSGRIGVVSIEPWDRPEPDGSNGYVTKRYTWDWFSDDELTEILRTDNPRSILEGSDGS